MKISVRYFFDFARIAGMTEETVDMPPMSTLEQLFETLVSRHGKELRTRIFGEDCSLSAQVAILLNGRTLEKHKELFGHMLSENDVLSVIPPVSGG